MSLRWQRRRRSRGWEPRTTSPKSYARRRRTTKMKAIAQLDVEILSDPRGWLIRPRAKHDLLRLGTALRTTLPADDVLVARGGYLVRTQGLSRLVEMFPPEAGGWDER